MQKIFLDLMTEIIYFSSCKFFLMIVVCFISERLLIFRNIFLPYFDGHEKAQLSSF